MLEPETELPETEFREIQPETALETAPEVSQAPSEVAPEVTEAELIALAEQQGLAAVEGGAEASGPTASTIDLSSEERAELTASMESVLFMSDKPVSLPKLRATLRSEIGLSVYRELMQALRDRYAEAGHGIEISELSLGFQFRTKPAMANTLRRMIKTQPLKLTSANMETLAIIAYKQPLTKEEVDQLRGVDCGYLLRSLMEKRLIRIAGRSELPGKPMLYGTTHEFLELFNLKDLKALPALHEVESLVAATEAGEEENLKHSLDHFSKMVASSDTVLFDDSKLDVELEEIRQEIASVSTSTAFIDEQKALEKAQAQAELEAAALQAQTERHTEMIQTAMVEAGAVETAAIEAITVATEVGNSEPRPLKDSMPEVEPALE